MRKSPVTHIAIVIAFVVNLFGPIPLARAEGLALPKPGEMVHLSKAYTPVLLKGMIIHPENPFQFDFIVNPGEQSKRKNANELKQEADKLIKYFLASLAIPDEDQWVNLSPYEKNRMIPEDFGKTQMGRDLLAQDYLLKQITASLIYPENDLGKKFWKEIYAKAQAQFGTTNIPVNTFNKVWIVPDSAQIYEKDNGVFLGKSHLKVMLEEDYLSISKNVLPTRGHVSEGDVSPSRLPSNEVLNVKATQRNQPNALGSQIVREIVLPALEKEVNEGENFALLRQAYSAMILAAWYKNNLKQSLLSKIYVDQNKINGLTWEKNKQKDNKIPQEIYQDYLKAFKKGAFNLIKEEVDPKTQQITPRKYFSGGIMGVKPRIFDRASLAENSTIKKALGPDAAVVSVEMRDSAMNVLFPQRNAVVGVIAALAVIAIGVSYLIPGALTNTSVVSNKTPPIKINPSATIDDLLDIANKHLSPEARKELLVELELALKSDLDVKKMMVFIHGLPDTADKIIALLAYVSVYNMLAGEEMPQDDSYMNAMVMAYLPLWQDEDNFEEKYGPSSRSRFIHIKNSLKARHERTMDYLTSKTIQSSAFSELGPEGESILNQLTEEGFLELYNEPQSIMSFDPKVVQDNIERIKEIAGANFDEVQKILQNTEPKNKLTPSQTKLVAQLGVLDSDGADTFANLFTVVLNRMASEKERILEKNNNLPPNEDEQEEDTDKMIFEMLSLSHKLKYQPYEIVHIYFTFSRALMDSGLGSSHTDIMNLINRTEESGDLKRIIKGDLEFKPESYPLADRSMFSTQVRKGGIDFNASHLNFKTQRYGQGVSKFINTQSFENISIEGLIPFILDVQPALNSVLLAEFVS